MINRKKLAKYSSEIEFRAFKEFLKDEKESLVELPRLKEVRQQYGLNWSLDNDRQLQLSAGKSIIDFLKDENKLILECGGTLVYSMASNGLIAVILYPMKSEVFAPFEESILLRCGFYTCFQLQQDVKKDLRKLASYIEETRMFGEPSLNDKITVLWLRTTRPLTVDGKYKYPKIFTFIGKGGEFTFRTMAFALLKPAALIVVIAGLLYLGLDPLVQYISPNS
jgi:hypothetical protein